MAVVCAGGSEARMTTASMHAGPLRAMIVMFSQSILSEYSLIAESDMPPAK